MSQATRTQNFARSARQGGKEKFLLPSSRDSCSSRASRKMSRSPRLAHKAPVMQARYSLPNPIMRFSSFQLQFSDVDVLV